MFVNNCGAEKPNQNFRTKKQMKKFLNDPKDFIKLVPKEAIASANVYVSSSIQVCGSSSRQDMARN